MHVLISARVHDGILYLCECGKVMGTLEPPYNQEIYWHIILGHRQHVHLALGVEEAWRVGNNPNPGVRAYELKQERETKGTT